MNYPTLYALADCNHFYVSCERAFNPALANKPAAVLSNNDGCIVALSPELKQLGVTRGTPLFKIKHLIKKHDIRIFSSNYTLYSDMSFRVMTILEQFTPDLELYSIDEAFLNFSGLNESDFNRYGNTIRTAVRKCTGIPVSIGIAPTKTLAKLANRIAKKSGSGVFYIESETLRRKVLQRTGVEHIWGIGSRYAAKLKREGIDTAWQLSLLDDEKIARDMTIVGVRMVNELRGIACSEESCSRLQDSADIARKKKSSSVNTTYRYEPRQSIVSSKSFGRPVSKYRELQEALHCYADTALNKLRQQELVAKRITVYITTNPFKNEPQYANYREAVLPGYSAYPPDFTGPAVEMLKSIYREGFRYKKIGVMLNDIIRQDEAPLDIFDSAYIDDQRSDIMNCVDKINSRWGQGTVHFAGMGTNRKWQMRRQHLSPKYTTSWKELPVVKS